MCVYCFILCIVLHIIYKDEDNKKKKKKTESYILIIYGRVEVCVFKSPYCTHFVLMK